MGYEINPNLNYRKADLQALLEADGLRLRWFLDNVRPRKFARSHWLGSDILEAQREYTKQREREAIDRQAAVALARPGRKRKQTASLRLIPLPIK